MFTGDSKAARDESQSELFALLRKWLERSLVVAPAKVGKRNDSQKKKKFTFLFRPLLFFKNVFFLIESLEQSFWMQLESLTVHSCKKEKEKRD